MIKFLLGFLLSFFIGILLMPILLKILKRVKAKQTILHYVEAHKKKDGTPTLGGLVFIIAGSISFLIFSVGDKTLSIVSLLVFLAYGILGFLDDFIKIRTHKNLGLLPYQKIVGQVGIAILAAIFVYKSSFLGGTIYLPWSFVSVDIGWVIIPFIVITFLAMTNSANLTDGLDGLAGGVSFVALIAVSCVCLLTKNFEEDIGLALNILEEKENLALFGICVSGGVLAFLCFNSFPAKIFMGDTGSLALGGVLCAIATFCGQELCLVLICVTFVVSALSVILQVIHFKRTKKRIFLMAPLHHHFEKKGMNESKIVAIYIVVTIIASIIAVLLCLL